MTTKANGKKLMRSHQNDCGQGACLMYSAHQSMQVTEAYFQTDIGYYQTEYIFDFYVLHIIIIDDV